MRRKKKLGSGRYRTVDTSNLRSMWKASKGSEVEENDRGMHIDSYYTTVTARRLGLVEKAKDENNMKIQRKLTKFCPSITDEAEFSENMSFKGDCMLKYGRTYCRKKFSDRSIKASESYNREREVTLIIPWLDVYTDEGSEEDIEPLVNKRTEKRRKFLRELEGRSEQIGLAPKEVILLD